jgi:hypothetical protein
VKYDLSDFPVRFANKVQVTETGCWQWTGSFAQKTGYVCYKEGGKTYPAHRYAYEWAAGPIPAGLVIAHLCSNRACVNPAHLEPVTHQEHLRRGDTLKARKAAQTHCKRGHEFTPENTYVSKKGLRFCRACVSMRHRQYRTAGRKQ